MKYHCVPFVGNSKLSPSMRREWIEISIQPITVPPFLGLPPCGGSGLKCPYKVNCNVCPWSPSMRREWIEIDAAAFPIPIAFAVSLHAEGVD